MMETDKQNTQEENSEVRQTIARYLQNLPPSVLDVPDTHCVEVLELSHGAYNLNYHVKVAGRDFLFRINIEQQSGLAEQIEYEFRAIQFLNKHDISPKCYYIDTTKKHFEFDILIEEYLHGPYISFVTEEMPEIAELLAKLHLIEPTGLPLITWKDPLVDNYNQVCQDLLEYEAKKTPNKEVIRLTKTFLEKVKPDVYKYRHLYTPDGINHTDTALDNFIHTSVGLRLIDWEKPRFDDCSYDICCFLAEPCQLWCAPKVLAAEGREIFLENYINFSGRDPVAFREKVNIRLPLVSMHWVLWGANKLCDLRDNLTSAGLQEIHEGKVVRWERIADIRNIERLLENFEVVNN
jgi:thiamine kinase-like enzyme